MNRAITILLVFVMVLSLAACGKSTTTSEPTLQHATENTLASPSTTENAADTTETNTLENPEPTEETLDIAMLTAWYKENSMLICGGVYFVGKDILAAYYGITCQTASFGMNVIVFDTENDYYSYHRSSRFTGGEESAALEAYASQNDYISEGKTVGLNLKDGNVLLIKNGIAELSYSDSDQKADIETPEIGKRINVFEGDYLVGSDMEPGSYMITSTEKNGTMLVVFETAEKLADFENEDHFTNGEFSADIEKNAVFGIHINEGETCCVNLKEGMVLLVHYGTGAAQQVKMGWSVS